MGWGELFIGTSLAVQWLRVNAVSEGGMGLIPGLGTKIPLASKVQLKCIQKGGGNKPAGKHPL